MAIVGGQDSAAALVARPQGDEGEEAQARDHAQDRRWRGFPDLRPDKEKYRANRRVFDISTRGALASVRERIPARPVQNLVLPPSRPNGCATLLRICPPEDASVKPVRMVEEPSVTMKA